MYKKQLSVREKIAGGVFLFIVVCLWAYGQVSSSRGEIGVNTSCSYVVQTFDAEDRDAARQIVGVVDRVMAARDATYVSQGQPSVLGPLSEEGYQSVQVMPVEFCRKNMASTLGRQAADAYDGLRGMNKSFGTIP